MDIYLTFRDFFYTIPLTLKNTEMSKLTFFKAEKFNQNLPILLPSVELLKLDLSI